MLFPHLRPGKKIAIGVYAGARLLDLFRGGRWNGHQQEISAFVRTLPSLINICDQLVVLVDEARTVLAPTVTPVRARRQRRLPARKRGP